MYGELRVSTGWRDVMGSYRMFDHFRVGVRTRGDIPQLDSGSDRRIKRRDGRPALRIMGCSNKELRIIWCQKRSCPYPQ